MNQLSQTLPINNFLKFSFINLGKEHHISVSDIISIFLVIIFTLLILRYTKTITYKYLINKKIEIARFNSFFQIIKYLVWLIASLIILKLLTINLSLILTSLAALSLALVFGLQHIVTDVAAGIIILFDRTIQLWDVITVDNIVGKVEKIHLRDTHIRTKDDYIIIIPNRKLIGESVINWTHHGENSRFHITIIVEFGSDTKKISQILVNCAMKHHLVAQSKKPFVRIEKFIEYGIEMKLLFWSKEVFYIDNILSDIRFMIDKQFHLHSIKIPFPQREIHYSSINAVEK